MESVIPAYIRLVFLVTALTTIGFIHFGTRSAENKGHRRISWVLLTTITVWMATTGIMASRGFFLEFDTLPPRLVFIVLPPNLAILGLLIIKRSRNFILQIPISTLTYVHIIRVPVEMVLWWLAAYDLVPLLLTFEGINYDILSGVTAPFVAIFMVGRKRKNRIGAIIWNLAALAMLVNIVSHAILSTPYPFQQYSLDQPMTAVFYPPFVWLPALVVPIVLFSHLASLMQLLIKKEAY